MLEKQITKDVAKSRTNTIQVGNVIKSLINSLNLMQPNGAEVHTQKNILTGLYGMQTEIEENKLSESLPSDLEESNSDFHERFIGLTARVLSFGARL